MIRSLLGTTCLVCLSACTASNRTVPKIAAEAGEMPWPYQAPAWAEKRSTEAECGDATVTLELRLVDIRDPQGSLAARLLGFSDDVQRTLTSAQTEALCDYALCSYLGAVIRVPLHMREQELACRVIGEQDGRVGSVQYVLPSAVESDSALVRFAVQTDWPGAESWSVEGCERLRVGQSVVRFVPVDGTRYVEVSDWRESKVVPVAGSTAMFVVVRLVSIENVKAEQLAHSPNIDAVHRLAMQGPAGVSIVE